MVMCAWVVMFAVRCIIESNISPTHKASKKHGFALMHEQRSATRRVVAPHLTSTSGAPATRRSESRKSLSEDRGPKGEAQRTRLGNGRRPPKSALCKVCVYIRIHRWARVLRGRAREHGRAGIRSLRSGRPGSGTPTSGRLRATLAGNGAAVRFPHAYCRWDWEEVR
ncbi:hypothetical protein C8T65DRAFT_99669 [Cerioporus squamosus]|nr:hypothetical protein C8T65DRAFT_99669 [Cerioporus squamosus]